MEKTRISRQGRIIKKAAASMAVLLCMSAPSYAGEKTLHDIAVGMFDLAESTLDCAAEADACTAETIVRLKVDAENGLRELVKLFVSGNAHGEGFTSVQINDLSVRVKMQQERLVNSEMFAVPCNLGLYLLDMAPVYLMYGILNIKDGMKGLAYIGLGIAAVPAGCLLLLTCLFWWL